MTSVSNESEMKALGEKIGQRLRGGEVIELVGDVGAGKTTFTKGVGVGLVIDDDIQSPSFTISRVYDARDGLQLHHYDFYRLDDAGLMGFELAEAVSDAHAVTIVEWADSVRGVLPDDRIRIDIKHTPNGTDRIVIFSALDNMKYLVEGL